MSAPGVTEQAADVPDESVASGWGMPRVNQLSFHAFADQREVVIDVRPTNLEAVKWLTLGALPKPEEIKSKTINALDVRLGAREEHRGLVGFFEPRLPEGVPADDPVRARYRQRLEEYRTLRAHMDELEREGRFRTVDGLVQQATDEGNWAFLTGDHDILRITRRDGTPLPADEYEALIEEMKKARMGVMHGMHLAWNPRDAFGRKIYDTINAAHRHNGGEPLLRFEPHRGKPSVAYLDSWADVKPLLAPSATDTQTSGDITEDAPGETTEDPERTKPATDPLGIDEHLDRRRPPRIDRELPPPAREREQARFTDDSRMPAHLDGIRNLLPGLPEEVLARSTAFGVRDFALRGRDQVLREIARGLQARPETRLGKGGADSPAAKALLADIDRALREDLGGLSGDGREFTYTDAKGKVRVVHLAVRHYGHWERFTDLAEQPRSIGVKTRGQRLTGGDQSQSTTYSLNPLAPLWPLTKPFGVYARLGLRFAHSRAVGYTLTGKVMSRTEASLTGASRPSLDDVYYQLTVSEAGGKPAAGDAATTPVAFGFAVRGGLRLRLADSAISESKPGRIPPLITYRGTQQHHRFVVTEDFGPVAHIRDWATGQVGALPGTSAHRELNTFFSSQNFQRNSRLLGAGTMTTPPLFGKDKQGKPLGVFTVRTLPRRAVLIDETTAAALKDMAWLTLIGERSLSTTDGQELQAGVGPVFQWLGLAGTRLNLRFILGFVARHGHRTTRTTTIGGEGGNKVEGAVKDSPTGLYLVEKTVVVRRSGRDRDAAGNPRFPEGRFVTWSLDQMPRAEARRLAGWDDGTRTRVRSGAPQPTAPAYLTLDHPPTLGASRAEEFTHDTTDAEPAESWLEQLAEKVVQEAARAYPGLVAPLSELDPDNPRWRDADHFATVLNNTLEIYTKISHHSLASNLEGLTTQGIRIRLRETARFKRGYRYLWVDGELTARHYEGTQNGLAVKYYTAGTEKLEGEHGVGHDQYGGVESSFTLRTVAATSQGFSRRGGTAFLGLSGGRGQGQSSLFGPSNAVETAVGGTRPPHLFSYRLTVTVSRGGYWRLPALMRGIATAGLLGTQPFVFREKSSLLIGTADDGSTVGGGPVSGRVILSVLDEHMPKSDPHADDADNPFRDFGSRITTTSMDSSQALALATSAPGVDRNRQPFENHGQVTLGILGSAALVGAAEESLKSASGGSWHLTQIGAAPHDSALLSFQAPYLTANADQTLSPSGWRATELWAKGPYLNRSGVLFHRMTVSGLWAMTPPAPMSATLKMTGATLTGGKNAVTYNFVFGGQFSTAQAQRGDHGPLGSYGLSLSPWTYARGRTGTVTFSISNEIARQDKSHQVLVSGTAEHDIAVASSALGGTTGAGSRLVPGTLANAAGRRVAVPGGWMGLLSEHTAVTLNLIDDGWGTAPLYDAQTWSPQPWLVGNTLCTYPLGELDPSEVMASFDQALRGLSLPESDHDTVLRLVSGRLLRALRGEMENAGQTIPLRTGHWGWDGLRIGTRRARLRVQLVAGTSRFHRLGHSTDFEDNLWAISSTGFSVSRTRGPDFGLSVSESAYTGNPDASAAGPGFSESGSARRTLAASGSDNPVDTWAFATSEPYAEYDTSYRLRIALEVDDDTDSGTPPAGRGRELVHRAREASRSFRGKRAVVKEGEVGTLRKQTPLSLMSPDTDPAAATHDDPLGPPALPTPSAPRRVTFPTTHGDDDWRRTTLPDGTEGVFEPPAQGFQARGVLGVEQVRASGYLAIAAAYDIGFRDDGDDALVRAKDTGLTRLDTGSSHSLDEGTNNTVLAAHYFSALGAGYPVPGLVEDSLVGGADGSLVLHAKPHFERAVLMTVAPGTNLQRLARRITAGGASASGSEGYGAAFDVGSGASAAPAGSLRPGLSAAGPNATGVQGGGHTQDVMMETTVDQGEDLAFLFAVPTTWISSAAVQRHIKDSAIGRAVISPFRKGWPKRFGSAGQKAYETEAAVIVWVRQDVARQLGLIDDTSFPEEAAKAWEAVQEASTAWVEADKKYWEARRETGAGPRDDLARAERELTAAERELTAARDAQRGAERPLAEARAAAEAADHRATALVQEARARAAEERGAAEDSTPEHDGWAEMEREWLAEADRAVAVAEVRAAELRADATRQVTRAQWTLVRAELAVREATRTAARATATRDAARTEADRARQTIDGLQNKAEQLATEYHRVRGAADRLTRWHRLNATEDGRARLDGTPKPPAVTFTDPTEDTDGDATPDTPRYTPDEGDAPTGLVAPDGERFTLHDVPRDGQSFLHALAEGLHRIDPELLSREGLDTSSRESLVTGIKGLLAARLVGQGNADLLEVLAPDTTDTFTGEEIDVAGIEMGDNTPERREFDALRVIPESLSLSSGDRLGLAYLQLLRPGDAEGRSGWDHGAADIWPLLAARTFGVPVRVVMPDGSFYHFSPDTGAGTDGTDTADSGPPPLVLWLGGEGEERHYQLALPEAVSGTAPAPGLPAPIPAPTPAPRDITPPEDAAVRSPAHTTPPWTPSEDGDERSRFDAATDHRTLTGPDGKVYDLVEAEGDGNRFYAAIVAARSQAPAGPRTVAPGRDTGGGVPGATELSALPGSQLRRNLANRVAAQPLPEGARLDPAAVFHPDEVAGLSLELDAAQRAGLRRDLARTGGRVPQAIRKVRANEEALLRENLRAARRWDSATASLAAELTAHTEGITLILVSEDGTNRTYGPPKAGETVTLYQRGTEFLIARPRPAADRTETGRNTRSITWSDGRNSPGGRRPAVDGPSEGTADASSRAVAAEATAASAEATLARREAGAVRALRGTGRAVDTAAAVHRRADLERTNAVRTAKAVQSAYERTDATADDLQRAQDAQDRAERELRRATRELVRQTRARNAVRAQLQEIREALDEVRWERRTRAEAGRRLSPSGSTSQTEGIPDGNRRTDDGDRAVSAPAGSGPAAPTLSSLLPEDSWWRLFIDANVHSDAFRLSPDDVGGHLDAHKYPGYRQSMMEAYREVLDGGGTGRDWSRVDADAYEELHDMATRYLVTGSGQNTATTWSGYEHGRTTMRPIGSDGIAEDLKDEVLLGRPLLVSIKDRYPAGSPKPLVVFHHGLHGGQVSIDYTPQEARGIVQAALDRYYAEVAVAASPDEKLRAIARVTRTLQILQPFTDANSRVNVHILMHKFLLEQGFRPSVLMDSRSLFLGGFTVGEIAERLKEGMVRFDRHRQWARWDRLAGSPQAPDSGTVDQLADAMGMADLTGTPDERLRRMKETARTAQALLGPDVHGTDAADRERLTAVHALTAPALARFPGQSAPEAIVGLTQEVFSLETTDDVTEDHLVSLLAAVTEAQAQDRPVDVDTLGSLAVPPQGDDESEDGSEDASVDGARSAPPTGETHWDALAYVTPDDGLKPLVFEVSELTGGAPASSPDDLVEALMPRLAQEAPGGFRLVLRAGVRALGGDPTRLVSDLVNELDAPVDLLLAGRDGTVRLLRFDDHGDHEDLGPVATDTTESTAYPHSGQINATPDLADDLSGLDLDSGSRTAPWSVSSWRTAGSAGAVRFASMYRDREWRQLSAEYEFAVAQQLGEDPATMDAARRAVVRLYEDLTARMGEAEALRAFFPSGEAPVDGRAALERLRTLPAGPGNLAQLMATFTRAVYAGQELPSAVQEALSRPDGEGRFLPGSAYREVHDERGRRRVGGVWGPASRLLQVYRDLGASPEELREFRGALVTWMVPADLQSLSEILRTSHRMGVGDAAERAAVGNDGARLHVWAHTAFGLADVSDDLLPPHQILYGERMRYSAELTGGIDVPDTMAAAVEAALASASQKGNNRRPTLRGDNPRRSALGAWLRRHGARGTEALKRLRPAHLTALHLYSEPDYRLMKAVMNGQRLGTAMSRHVVRLATRALVRQAVDEGWIFMVPITLRNQPDFQELYDELDELGDLVTPSDELSSLLRRLDEMADAVHDELSLHVDMAIEALELLPPVVGTVWWGDRGVPGQLDEDPVDGPVYGVDTITVPFFRSTSLDQETALRKFALADKPLPHGTHRALVEIASSTGRDIAPFSEHSDEDEALYPPGTVFRVTGRSVLQDAKDGLSYELISAEEAPPASTPQANDADEAQPVAREVRGRDGRLVGEVSFDEGDWASRREDYRRLDGTAEFVAWERDEAGRKVAGSGVLPGGGSAEGTFFFASHGGADGFGLATDGGGVRRDDGSYVGRLLEGVRERGFRSATVLSCGPGDVPGSVAEARARARRIAEVSGLTVHMATGRVAVTASSEGGPARIHLLEDAQGRRTEWVTEHPPGSPEAATAPPAVTSPDTTSADPDIAYPQPWQFNGPDDPDRPRQIESWKITGAPDTPRSEADASAGMSDAEAEDEPETGSPTGAQDTTASVAGYRRTGPYAAQLDGVPYALHASPEDGDRPVDALLFTLRYAAPAALEAAGVDSAGSFRDWLARHITDADLSDVALPPLDRDRQLPLSLLESAGVQLTAAQRMQGALLGDVIPAADVTLSPTQRFRLALADPSYGVAEREPTARAFAATAARELGVAVAVVGEDGSVDTYGGGGTDDGALLVLEGDRSLAGLPHGPEESPDQQVLRRVTDALTAAPDSVRRWLGGRAADDRRNAGERAPEWIQARVRYLEEGERFEERLGWYLGDHEAANDQLEVMVRAVWDRAVAADVWQGLGSADFTVDGTVGTGRDQLLAVVESGNLRERMGLLWVGARTISGLLGSPDPDPPLIHAERGDRLPSSTMTAYERLREQARGLPPADQSRLLADAERMLRVPVAQEDVRPELSDAERALMPDDGVPWIPGRNRWNLAMGSRLQSDAEATGGLVRAGTSGSSYRLMMQAVRMRDAWGLDIDLGLVRVALMAEMLSVGHHSLHEIMAASQLILDHLRERGTPESPELDYIDNWSRYWHIAPLTEAELRANVATDGRFPDEHVLDTAGWPTGVRDDGQADGPGDPEAAAWFADHRGTLGDVLDLLAALGSGTVLDTSEELTPELLRRLIDDWFRTRGLEPSGSLAEDLRRILDDPTYTPQRSS